MKEKEVRERAIKELKSLGYATYWYPIRPSFTFKDFDIFGVFDIVAIKGSTLIFVQYTTRTNVNARIRKVIAFFTENKVFVKNAWVWGWDKKENNFFKLKLTDDVTESLGRTKRRNHLVAPVKK